MKFTIEVTNSRCKILEIMTLSQLSVIDELCRFRVEGGEYNPKFKGKWDGYKRMFSTRYQTFPIGLLNRVRGALMTYGIDIEVKDKRKRVASGKYHTINICNYGDRQYQTDAVMASLVNGNGIIKAATGSGKTTISARTIAAISRPSIFIVHTRDLLYQTIESFQNLFPEEKIGQIGDGIIDYQYITVATIQTISILGNLRIKDIKSKYDEDGIMDEKKIEIDKKKMEDFTAYKKTVEVIMMDEVQRVGSDIAYSSRFMFEHANYAFGYSASPWRDDGADLMIESAFGSRIVDINASMLIRMGFLVKPTIYIKTAPVNKSSDTKYPSVYAAQVTKNVLRNIMVANDAIDAYNRGENTLILVTMIEHGKTIEKIISEMGVDVSFISGKSGMKKRKQAIQDMRDGKISLMIASTIADVGLDIPRLDTIVEAGAGKSSVTALQRLGRIMRPFKNKSKCTFYTYRDNVPYIRDHIMRKIDIWRTEEEFEIVEV